MKRLLPAIFSLILIIGCIAFLYTHSTIQETPIERTTAYLASSDSSVTVYREEDHLLYVYDQMVRGTAVTSRNVTVEVNDGSYQFLEIELDGQTDEKGNPIVYYVSTNNVTADLSDVVQENTKYVRTSVTVYSDADSPQISSFLKKGTELSICGYAGLNEDGTVEMYQISNAGSEGYVYAKYLVDTSEEANAVYSSIADTHAGRTYDFELYGGSTETLDWYPVTKGTLSSGELLEDARAIYLSASAANPEWIDSYISLAQECGANAVVVDVKDGILTYASDVAASLCPSAYSTAYLSSDDFLTSIQKLKDAGLYVIGRIVVFNDDLYAQDHPEESIISDGITTSWPSAYSRNCWYYNIALAQEAVTLFGFNEIQFDYVRFPENAYTMSLEGNTDFRNTYDEEKAEAIQNFCFYAADQLHRVGAYVSVDVFGESVQEYVTAYGQYWPAISNVVDVISGMPYTDHFEEDSTYWTYPYTTVYQWAAMAAMRQTEIRTPAIARTWITGYDTPYWNPTITYGETALIEQAQALYDSGLTGGFILWNASSDLNKYYSYMTVWNDQYH